MPQSAARADDLVHAGDGGGAVGQRGNGVRAADAEQTRDASFERGRHHHRCWAWADDDNLADAGSRGGNRGHQQGRGERIPARRHVAADAIEREDALFDGDARRHARAPAARHLPTR